MFFVPLGTEQRMLHLFIVSFIYLFEWRTKSHPFVARLRQLRIRTRLQNRRELNALNVINEKNTIKM